MTLKSSSKVSSQYALLSVFDKTGIVELARGLEGLGYSIVSTGGTAKVLIQEGINVTPIEKITGNPEAFDGRMKTISFQIEGGILFDRTNAGHVSQAKKLQVPEVSIVVCNLYPFEQTLKKPKVTHPEIIENIDVGGPTMVRSAAKNYRNVLVVTDPEDYTGILAALLNNKADEKFREYLAAKAFGHLTTYDSQIAQYFNGRLKIEFPDEVTVPGRKEKILRYGENPHQQAVLYLSPGHYSPFEDLKCYGGRDLSYLNVTDINSGIESVRLFKEPAAVVIKHNTPCGIALGESISQALSRAIVADPVSAFGGVVVLNRPLDSKSVQIIKSFKDEMHGQFDIVASPGVEKSALEEVAKIRKSMGIYTFGKITGIDKKEIKFKEVLGGFILQNADYENESYPDKWEVVTKINPTKKQLEQMKIAWKISRRIRSNTIIVMDRSLPMTRGIGNGQTSRIKSAEIALQQAGEHCKDAVMASDSFFPFDDSVKLAAKAGIGAIIQQGESIRDQDSIDAANEAGIAMVFTRRRAFWH